MKSPSPSPAAALSDSSPALPGMADSRAATPGASGDGLLSTSEAANLAFCERRVAAGLESFRDVGLALAQIRDGRLYRATNATFEEYCRQRWGWSARRGYQLMEAAEAIASLPTECAPVVHTERAARELANVEPDKRAEVLAEAAQGGKATAKRIKEAAAKANGLPTHPEPVREDDGMRELRLTNKVNAALDELEDYLAGMNPTRRDLLQAATMYHSRAKRLELSAARLDVA